MKNLRKKCKKHEMMLQIIYILPNFDKGITQDKKKCEVQCISYDFETYAFAFCAI